MGKGQTSTGNNYAGAGRRRNTLIIDGVRILRSVFVIL